MFVKLINRRENETLLSGIQQERWLVKVYEYCEDPVIMLLPVCLLLLLDTSV